MTDRVLCFGEILLRLAAPGRELLLQTPLLDVHVGGAEANVTVSLAAFGHASAMAGVLPANPLGYAARDALRAPVLKTTRLNFNHGSIGLYFYTLKKRKRHSEVL